jgi:hypothetical protein
MGWAPSSRGAQWDSAWRCAGRNVEHFQNREPQNAARIAFLADQRPDVIAIYEAEGSEVWRELMDAFPKYSFFITEGIQYDEAGAPGDMTFKQDLRRVRLAGVRTADDGGVSRQARQAHRPAEVVLAEVDPLGRAHACVTLAPTRPAGPSQLDRSARASGRALASATVQAIAPAAPEHPNARDDRDQHEPRGRERCGDVRTIARIRQRNS